MKKTIKIIIIVVVIIGLITGGLFIGYSVKQKSKSAQVCSLSNYAMDDYWGDSIESYGMVTSDKSQIIYLSSSDKIKSIEVEEGDEVKEGDVLMIIESSSSDLKGKTLELEKEQNKLKVAKTKLERLEKTTPIPDADNMEERETKKSKSYVSKIVYKPLNNDYPASGYTVDTKVAEEVKDKDGKTVAITYFDSIGEEITAKSFEDLYHGKKVDADDAASYYSKTEETSKYEWIAQVDYVNSKTGKVIGSDILNENGDEVSTFDLDGKYTETELADAIFDQQQATKKLDLSVRKMSLELKQASEAAGSGEILAKVDGKVTKVQDINNINFNSSIISISGTDEYYISGTVGEFYLSQVKPGDTCTVSSWETGASAEATITEVEEYPSERSGWSNGNSNASDYPFKAAFDISSGIEIGDTVDISISGSQSEGGFYVYNAFVRKDSKGNYVMRMNEDNKLERVPVTTGKSLWGSYVEITSGNLTIDDYLAFPYGDGAIEGVNCEIVDYLG